MSSVFLDIYGLNGRHPDSDFYYSIVSLLNKLRIKYKPCEIKLSFLKKILPFLIPGKASISYNFINNLACSMNTNDTVHSKLMSQGIQAATLKSANF